MVRESPQGLALLFSHKAKQRNGVHYEGSDAQDASRREAVKNQPKGPAAAQQNGGGNSSTAARTVEAFTHGDLRLSAASRSCTRIAARTPCTASRDRVP